MSIFRVARHISCRRTRRLLDEWLDERKVGPLPAGAAEHLRDCARCRGYVSQWSAVELQLRSLREEWQPLAEPSRSLRNLCRTPCSHTRVTALATAMHRLAFVAIVAILLAGSLLLLKRNYQVLARRATPSPNPTVVEPGRSLGPDLPVAATR